MLFFLWHLNITIEYILTHHVDPKQKYDYTDLDEQNRPL